MANACSSAYCVSGTILSTLNMSTHSALLQTREEGKNTVCHFTEEETEARTDAPTSYLGRSARILFS